LSVSYAFSAADHENSHEIALSRNVFGKFPNFVINFHISQPLDVHCTQFLTFFLPPNKFQMFSIDVGTLNSVVYWWLVSILVSHTVLELTVWKILHCST